MKVLIRMMTMGVLVAGAMATTPAIAAPSPPPCYGEPICIGLDGNGNLVICGPSGICIPWDTSMPPIPPPDPDQDSDSGRDSDR